MSDIEVPDVVVGQRVILLGKDWKGLNLQGFEVEIAGHADIGTPFPKQTPYFHDPLTGGLESKLYVYRNPKAEDYSAEVIPLEPDEDEWEPTPIERWANEVSGQIAEAYGAHPEWKVEVPGVGYGVATSEEDYEAMKVYLAEQGPFADPERPTMEEFNAMEPITAFPTIKFVENEPWHADYTDSVTPDHYKFGNVRVMDIVRHLAFPEGNVIKYVARAGRKGARLEDLLKARKYLDIAIENAEEELE